MRYFYDSHCHMMNLSHPNLTAIIKRIYTDNIKPLFLRYVKPLKIALVVILFVIPTLLVVLLLTGHFLIIKLMLYGVSFMALILFAYILFKFGKKDNRAIAFSKIQTSLIDNAKEKLANVLNLLAIMETDIGDCLIQMEEDLRKNLPLNSSLVISGNGETKQYDKMVLTPLIMDFGLKDSGNSRMTYKVRWKPIVAQVEDLCTGIRDYYRHRGKYLKEHPEPLFQIIPFMGVNTQNYYSEKDKATGKNISVSLKQLLEKNFKNFKDDLSPQIRRKHIDEIPWKDFNGNIESLRSHYFLGIKVYPPLGFDPWPEPGEERDKVCFLYDFCVEYNVPITAHCNPGGFLVHKDFSEYSSPFKWESVLKTYKNLRLNLAHFGGTDGKEWRRKIADMILEKDSETDKYKYESLYADISYQGVDESSYKDMMNFINSHDGEKRSRLLERIIFGSDFMINLQDINSYSKYLRYFIDSDTLTLEEKDMLCNKNAERFLYIG